MERIFVTLTLPRDFLGALAGPEDQREHRLTLLIALELFREEKISSGLAEQVPGLSKARFIDELDRREIPYFTETPAELPAQVAAVRELDDGEVES